MIREELPQGVTFNEFEEDPLEVELPFEVVSVWQCEECELFFEALLIGENKRYQGQLRTSGNNAITWQGPLPKDETKARKFLQETLIRKVDTHKSRH